MFGLFLLVELIEGELGYLVVLYHFVDLDVICGHIGRFEFFCQLGICQFKFL